MLFGKKLGKYQFSLKPQSSEVIIPNTDKKNSIIPETRTKFFIKIILNDKIFIKRIKNNLCPTIFSKMIQNSNKNIIMNNCIKAKLDAMKRDSVSVD